MARPKAVAKKKSAAVAKKRGRKPTLYVTYAADLMELDGPFTVTQLAEYLEGLNLDDLDQTKVFKLENEVQFKRIPHRIEIQNGSGS